MRDAHATTRRRGLTLALLGLMTASLTGCGFGGPLADLGLSSDSPALSRQTRPAPEVGTWRSGEVLIGYESEAELRRLVRTIDGRIEMTLEEVRAARVALPADRAVPEVVSRLNRTQPDGLRYTEPNYIRKHVAPNVGSFRAERGAQQAGPADKGPTDGPPVAAQQARRFDDPRRPGQWALEAMTPGPAWQAGTGTGTIVGVVDTGIDGTHPDLRGKQVTGRSCYDQAPIPPNTDSSQGEMAHGTHVAGIAAAHGGNGEGIVGVAPDARIMPLRIFDARLASDDNPAGYVGDANVARCLMWAALEGPDGVPNSGDEADVLNNSWGGRGYSQTLKNAIDTVVSNGTTFVNSMGNSSEDEVLYPKGYPGVLAVGATTPTDQRVDFSTMGGQISVGAPGVDILSTIPMWATQPNGEPYGYQYFSGTSMAAPQVSGAVALLAERFPDATPYQLQTILEQTAQDIEQPGFDRETGHGRLDLGNLAEATRPPDEGARVAVQVVTGNRADTNHDGRITDADEPVGVPATDVVLRQDGRVAYFAKTNTDGEAVFSHVRPGDYDVTVAGGDATAYRYRPANRIRAQTRIRARSGETARATVTFDTELTVTIRWEAAADVDLWVREPRPSSDSEELAHSWVGPKDGARWGTFSEDATGTGSGPYRERYTLDPSHYPYAPYRLAIATENADRPVEVEVAIRQNGYTETYGPYTIEPGQVHPSTEWSDWWENHPREERGFEKPGPGAPWVY